LREKIQQVLDVEGRAVGRLETENCSFSRQTIRRIGTFPRSRFDGMRVGAHRLAQCRRLQAVVLHKSCVEAAHAGKAAEGGYVRHRQRRVGEKLLGRQQAARLQVAQRCKAPVRLEDAA